MALRSSAWRVLLSDAHINAHTSVTVCGGVGMQQCMIRNHIFNI